MGGTFYAFQYVTNLKHFWELFIHLPKHGTREKIKWSPLGFEPKTSFIAGKYFVYLLRELFYIE